ncbi:conserved hypothetical protein [Sulfolobus islandicus Y.G.57.14]|uniref:Uncharacterized protein n=10 Tax=Saccharolobus islandicus TaxID=43080 RepID=M9UHD6_SACIS|nr:hypothetical protein [Sulfolobus islandicus]ACP36890.1 conserved hypothetical protein [Sulfolobus islandicus L.S.2.15]ACP39499.1 conserved hypothetical protein [Sulfolobus islandicus M.14.25]ACP47197.1 conserved hypothetical protein [Sulfolobus islandicus Y.G.57.14]ACP50047.1 conserved hypothetical protein [Sulfolobus islandicus Y.N.15.51]ACP56684.1 conserved hypothetical protein [Sulfolobus islandicus M.16.27]
MTTRGKEQQKKRRYSESITAFKKELKALSFEPIYGESIKDIIARLTVKIEDIANQYKYAVEFPEKAEIEAEGDVYYFIYPITLKTKTGRKKIYLHVQYLMYDQNQWAGMITGVK